MSHDQDYFTASKAQQPKLIHIFLIHPNAIAPIFMHNQYFQSQTQNKNLFFFIIFDKKKLLQIGELAECKLAMQNLSISDKYRQQLELIESTSNKCVQCDLIKSSMCSISNALFLIHFRRLAYIKWKNQRNFIDSIIFTFFSYKIIQCK